MFNYTNVTLLFQTFITRAREFQLDISNVDISRINEKLRQTIYPFQKEGIQYVLNYVILVKNLFSLNRIAKNNLNYINFIYF